MESAWSRANMVTAFAMSWSFGMVALVNVEQYFSDRTPVVDFDVKKINIHREYVHDRYRKTDVVDLTFDLDIDMTDVFDWNTWTVFVYLVAEYETPDRAVNQAVFWDHIMTSEDTDHTLNLRNKRWEYDVGDYANDLLGHENVTVSLHYNRIPMAGILPNRVAGPRQVLSIPSAYKRR